MKKNKMLFVLMLPLIFSIKCFTMDTLEKVALPRIDIGFNEEPLETPPSSPSRNLIKTINKAENVIDLTYVLEEKVLVACSRYKGGKLIIWDAISGARKQEMEIPLMIGTGIYLPVRKEYICLPKIFSVDSIPEKEQLVVGEIDGLLESNIKLIDLATQKVVTTFSGHKGGNNKCIYLKDRKQILSIASNGTPFQLWDPNSGVGISFDCDGKFPHTQ